MGTDGIQGADGVQGVQGVQGAQAVYQDFQLVTALNSDVSMSDLFDNESYNNASIMFDIDASRDITVDVMASNDNYFILSNTSTNPINVTFDYSNLSNIRFIGDEGYSSDDSIIIPMQSQSFIQFTFRKMGSNIIVYSVKPIASHVTLVDESDLSRTAVALVYKNASSNELKYLDVDTIGGNSVDIQGWVMQDYVRFTRGKNGIPVVIHKNALNKYVYAEYNRYKLYCDTTAAGGFHWKVTINNAAKQGDVTWAVGDTLDSIVAQMTGVNTYLVFSHDSGDDFIKVRKGGTSNSVFTLTNNTGATLVDLSLYTRVNGVQQAETHRDWQAQSIATLFPNSNLPAPTSKYYCENTYDMSQRTGANYPKYTSYWENNSSGNAWYPEDSTSKRMNRTKFASLDGDGNAEHQALFDKYNGSWDRYMAAAMNKKDDVNIDGIDYTSYDNGDVFTAFAASVETMDFDGSYLHVYTAAYNTSLRTDPVLGAYQMPTVHEVAVFMDDETMRKINTAFGYLTDVALLIDTTSYWAAGEYSEQYAWFYNGQRGEMGYNERYQNANAGRFVAYIRPQNP